MTIRTHFRQVRPTAEVGAARVSPERMSADERAIGVFGAALTKWGVSKLDAVIQSEYTEGKVAWLTSHTAFEEGLREDTDYKNYSTKYKAFNKKLQKDILLNTTMGGSGKALINYMALSTPSIQESIGDLAWLKKKDAMRASTIEAVRQFVSAGEAGKAEAALLEAKGLYMSAEEVGNRLANVRGDVAKAQKQKLLQGISEQAKITPYTEAITFINNIPRTLITEAERNGLIAQRKRQNEIETATHDPKVYMPLLRKVMKDPDSVSEEELYNAWGKGLDEKDYKELMKIKETEDHPLKSSRAKLYFGILDAVYSDVTKPKGEVDLDKILEYDQKNTELQNFFETNPDAKSPEKTKKFFDDLTAEAKSDWLGKLWESFVIGTGGRGFWPEKPKEKRTFKYIAINPNTGERMGSNDGIKWRPIP